MLEEIRIGSLGVIDASELELGPGLTVITGETGAGKTMIVTALGLLLGGRADSGAVRTGARAARIEGVVRADRIPGFAASVEEAGGEVEEDRVVLARNVSAEGRSRAFVGGATVPVSVLAELAEPLVAVHGQSDQHRLLRPRAQRDALDRFGGHEVAALSERYAALHDQLVRTERDLEEVVATARDRAREADLLRFGLGEIETVSPTAGEDAELAGEEARLGFADTLRTAAEQARETLSSETGQPDALAAASSARTLLDGVREHDAEAGELADRLAEISYLLSDVAADVASYAARLETDPVRLAAVSERRAALTALTRKYGETVDEVLAWAEHAAGRLTELDGTDDRIEELRTRRGELRTELGSVAGELSRARERAAGSLAEEVGTELGLLAMPDARVEIRVTQTEVADAAEGREPLEVGGRRLRFTSTGVDDIEFLLAANLGAEPRPLHKGASGGELSRVMLALEVSLAATSPVPTFVFDEVDAGVGGKAAVEVGRRLAQLARTAQVLVVTHLPAGGGVRRPPRGRREVQRRVGDDLRPDPARRRRAGARAVPDVRRPGGVRHRPGPRPGAARGGSAGARPGLTRSRRARAYRLPRTSPPDCQDCPVMKSVARPKSSGAPGTTGTVRTDRRTRALLPRLRAGDIALLDHVDLDQATAQALVDADVAAVLNIAPMISGRYPNLGPQVLARAGILMLDRVEGAQHITDGARIRIHDGVIFVGTSAVALGREVDAPTVEAELADARAGLGVQLETFTHNSTEFLRREEQLLLHGRGLPRPSTRIAGRPAVVVAPGPGFRRQLDAIRPYLREQDPVLVAVDRAADELLDAGLKPDIVVISDRGDEQRPAAKALRSARDVVVRVDRGGRLPTEQLERMGVRPLRLETGATTEDAALLLVHTEGAEVIVGVGVRATLDDFLDHQRSGTAGTFLTRLKVGATLVDAAAVPHLYAGRVRPRHLFLVILAGLLALAAAISVTPVGQEWSAALIDYLQGLLR